MGTQIKIRNKSIVVLYEMDGDSDKQEGQSQCEQWGVMWPISISKQQSLIYGYNVEDELNQIENDQQFLVDNFHENLIVQSFEDKENGKKFLNVFIEDEFISQDFESQKDATYQICNEQPQLVMERQENEINQKRPKFQNKSYCRYILLYVFRTIESEMYQDIVMDICQKFGISVKQFKDYYRKQRILIMGYQQLKKELIMDNDSIDVQRRKCAFKEFLIWYMDKLAAKHILNSKKQNLKEYLKFKNEVMSYYIHVPKNWLGNRPEWMKQQ